MFSFFAALLAPTVFVDSALWGQTDSIYTSMLVASIYFAIRRRPILSLFFFSVALSFKLQAIFRFPLFIVLLLKRRTHLLFSHRACDVHRLGLACRPGRPLTQFLIIHVVQVVWYLRRRIVKALRERGMPKCDLLRRDARC